MPKVHVTYNGRAGIGYYITGGLVAYLPSVNDHPKLGSCRRVRTSLVLSVSEDGTIETLNTIYVSVDKIAPLWHDGVTQEVVAEQRKEIENA